ELPGRRPEDGLLDWSGNHRAVYDFVRALTRPYPGAFSWLEGRRWTIWACAELPTACSADARPGTILGPVYSPNDSACGLAVACGTGIVLIHELEGPDGEVCRGRTLSDKPWKGKVWQNE